MYKRYNAPRGVPIHPSRGELTRCLVAALPISPTASLSVAAAAPLGDGNTLRRATCCAFCRSPHAVPGLSIIGARTPRVHHRRRAPIVVAAARLLGAPRPRTHQTGMQWPMRAPVPRPTRAAVARPACELKPCDARAERRTGRVTLRDARTETMCKPVCVCTHLRSEFRASDRHASASPSASPQPTHRHTPVEPVAYTITIYVNVLHIVKWSSS